MPSIHPANTAEVVKTEVQPNDTDLKSRTPAATEENVERGPTDVPVASDSPVVDEFRDNSQVPRYSPLRLFWYFFWRFGLFAWGGPVAQIALIKE